MTQAKGPGVPTLGALEEIDQLGSRINPRNSPTNLIAQASPLRAGNAIKCLVCGSAIELRRAGRRRKYCCYRCRDEARRERNFTTSGATRRGSPGIPRKSGDNLINSMACGVHVGDRAPAVIEVLGHGRKWPGSVPAEIAALIREVLARELGESAR